MAKQSFSENRIFEYNKTQKIVFGISVIAAGLILASFIALYIPIFSKSDFIVFRIINAFTAHIVSNIYNFSLLGSFYTSLIGGLFFVFLPLEVLFVKFINVNSSFSVIVLYLIGLTSSYSLNYFIGSKLARFSKKIISPKKFYGIKSRVNRWGAWAVFLFNVLPLPSQLLAAVLGVFKYNKTRFYVFFLLGQIVKYIAIIMGVYYII